MRLIFPLGKGWSDDAREAAIAARKKGSKFSELMRPGRIEDAMKRGLSREEAEKEADKAAATFERAVARRGARLGKPYTKAW